MKRTPLDAAIRSQVESFVAELTTLVRLATLQAVVEALEGDAGKVMPAVRAGMPKRSTKARAVVATETSKVASLDDYERAAIQRALVEADGNIVRAGKLLGMSKASIYRRTAALGVSNRGELVRPTLGSNLPLELLAYERAAFEGALNACGRSKLDAAKLLGLGKSTLYRRTEALGIET